MFLTRRYMHRHQKVKAKKSYRGSLIRVAFSLNTNALAEIEGSYREKSGTFLPEAIRELRLEDKIEVPELVKEIPKTAKYKRLPLENTLLAIIGSFGIIIGLFFLSSNLTGNVVSSLSQAYSNIIGIALFLIGLVGAFFYFKKEK
jgi:pilus assembly protein TadC